MTPTYITRSAGLEAVFPYERERLVRLCARLTGDQDAAEDLAQETLIEAWRNAHKLYDPAGYPQWLSAIARNVSLRWARSQGRERAQQIEPRHDHTPTDTHPTETIADAFDLEVELERSELAALLDRALEMLPPATRTLLIERFIREAPVTEMAERLQMTEGAVTMRLQRGKLQLRQVLETTLRDEAAAYGLAPLDTGAFEETRLWCPICGQERLRGCFESGSRTLILTCPQCTPEPDLHIVHGGSAELFEGIRGYRPAVKRVAAWGVEFFTRGLRDGVVPCFICGQPAQVSAWTNWNAPIATLTHGVKMYCPACGEGGESALPGFALALPQGMRFWSDHTHIRALPTQAIEVAGSPALVVGFEHLKGPERFDVVFAAESFQVLSIHHASKHPATGEHTP